jgi:hypothetical protein
MRSWWDQHRQFNVADFPREVTNEFYYPETTTQEKDEWTSSKEQGQTHYQYLINAHSSGDLPSSLVDSIGTEWGDPMWPNTTDPSWDQIASYSPPSGGGGGGGGPPPTRQKRWGEITISLRFPGDHEVSPNHMSMESESTPQSNVPGNITWGKFYTAAPPNGQVDSLHQIDFDSVRTDAGGGAQAWGSYAYAGLLTNTTTTAKGCRVQVRGDLMRRRVKTWCSERSPQLSTTTWFFDGTVTITQYHRGGYVVNKVNGTLLDSVSVALPDSARSVFGVVNKGDPNNNTTVEMGAPVDPVWVGKKP